MAGETPDQGEDRIINGRYRLTRTLGAGGMGRVWLAYDEELACEVAIKEIALADVPMDPSAPSQRIARARSEARHAARLRGHPHVATVHDVVMHEGLPWIVMEYVPDAVDLQAAVRRTGPLSPVQTARIGLAVLDALTAGHRIGILHRDVKPANILLASDASGDPYARVLLTDYGIALQPESREPRLTATAGILGTPGYLAPERARGEPPTPAADLFSLGATLYAAVEGRGPFDRHGDYATLTALLGEEPTPAEGAGELTPVLQGLLVKDPVRRSSPETAARGLERVVRGAPHGAADGGGGFGPPVGYVPSAPPGYVPSVPPGYVGSPTPGYVAGPEPGYVSSQPPEYAGGWSGGPGAGTPQTPGAPQGPNSPQTPHTPASGPAGPVTPGATPGSSPGPSAYDRWTPPTQQRAVDPANPYAQPTPGTPYVGGSTPAAPPEGAGGAPYAGSDNSARAPGSAVAGPYGGGGAPPAYPQGGVGAAPPYQGAGGPPLHQGGSATPPYPGAGATPTNAGAGPGGYWSAAAPTAYGTGGPGVPGGGRSASPRGRLESGGRRLSRSSWGSCSSSSVARGALPP
ncbi:protein kinase [Streptomyces sp. NPDC092369]|uniref:serine/threonine-protein kinase n=1 Tax=Streptomyces sp. NPDC092369 TaxID=3366015 RepID=UPI00381E2ACD